MIYPGFREFLSDISRKRHALTQAALNNVTQAAKLLCVTLLKLLCVSDTRAHKQQAVLCARFTMPCMVSLGATHPRSTAYNERSVRKQKLSSHPPIGCARTIPRSTGAIRRSRSVLRDTACADPRFATRNAAHAVWELDTGPVLRDRAAPKRLQAISAHTGA